MESENKLNSSSVSPSPKNQGGPSQDKLSRVSSLPKQSGRMTEASITKSLLALEMEDEFNARSTSKIDAEPQRISSERNIQDEIEIPADSKEQDEKIDFKPEEEFDVPYWKDYIDYLREMIKTKSLRLVPDRLEVSFPGSPIPEPPKRKTGMKTSEPPPPYWPTQVKRALYDLYQPEDEEDPTKKLDIHLQEPYEESAPWTLSDLAMEAMQGFLNREGRIVKNAKCIPTVLRDRFQQVLPLDVKIKHAIAVIDDGIYWKRLYLNSWPISHHYLSQKRVGFKTLYLQRWFSDYISHFEPEYFNYNEVLATTKLVAPWIYRLNIKELNAPKHKLKEPYNPNRHEDISNLDLDTCLKVRPKPRRFNLMVVLPVLENLEHFEICFGFQNYERYPTFSYARLDPYDLDMLYNALPLCPSLRSVRIYMCAFYSSDFLPLSKQLNNMLCLKKLEISNCKIDNEGAKFVAQFLIENRTIEMLSLKKNCITSEGVFVIAQVLAMRRYQTAPLKVFDLSFNSVGNLGALYLSCALLVNFTLFGLKLVGAQIGDTGGSSLAMALQVNRGIKKLDLTGNQLTDATARFVIETLETNPFIEEIDVRGNNISEVSLQDILELTKEERTFRREVYTQQRRGKHMDKWIGSKIEHLRKVWKKPWQAYDVSCSSSSFSDSDSGSITSYGSYSSGEITPEEIEHVSESEDKKEKMVECTCDNYKKYFDDFFYRFVDNVIVYDNVRKENKCVYGHKDKIVKPPKKKKKCINPFREKLINALRRNQ